MLIFVLLSIRMYKTNQLTTQNITFIQFFDNTHDTCHSNIIAWRIMSLDTTV